MPFSDDDESDDDFGAMKLFSFSSKAPAAPPPAKAPQKSTAVKSVIQKPAIVVEEKAAVLTRMGKRGRLPVTAAKDKPLFTVSNVKSHSAKADAEFEIAESDADEPVAPSQTTASHMSSQPSQLSQPQPSSPAPAPVSIPVSQIKSVAPSSTSKVTIAVSKHKPQLSTWNEDEDEEDEAPTAKAVPGKRAKKAAVDDGEDAFLAFAAKKRLKDEYVRVG